MAFLGKNRIKFIQLIVSTTSFLAVTQIESEEVTYTSYDSHQRWSSAANNCNSKGAFLAKIKNLDEIVKARQTFKQHHTTDYWVGVKYDESLNDFVWADGTRVASNANFEAIVNRAEQGKLGFSKRCLYATTEDVLVADDCGAHRKYICQVGESDDVILTSSPSPQPSSHVHVQSSSSVTTATATAAVTTKTTTTNTMKLAASSLPSLLSSSASSILTLSPSISPTPLLQGSSHTVTSSLRLPSSTSIHSSSYGFPTVSSTTVFPSSRIEKLITEHDSRLKQLNASEASSLADAVNLTSKLLENVIEIQNSGLKTNILVSCEKLEKFVLQYANLHMTSHNGSETELFMVQQEIGMTVMKLPAYHKRDVIFPSERSSFDESFIQEEKGAMRLPASLFAARERYVVCMLYKNAAELMPEEENGVDNELETTIRSRIISCSITPEIQGILNDDVIIKVKNRKRQTTAKKSSCAFWDFSIRTKFDGAWSKKGCTLVQETEEHTTCQCNHLTNFAVLMEVGETEIPDGHKFALEMVTYIGFALSLVGEILTILVYLILM